MTELLWRSARNHLENAAAGGRKTDSPVARGVTRRRHLGSVWYTHAKAKLCIVAAYQCATSEG